MSTILRMSRTSAAVLKRAPAIFAPRTDRSAFAVASLYLSSLASTTGSAFVFRPSAETTHTPAQRLCAVSAPRRSETVARDAVAFQGCCFSSDAKKTDAGGGADGGEKKKEARRKTALSPKKVTVLSLLHKKRKGRKITMVTAYDYPSALHVDRAGIDVLLVGDSCAMVELGFETTQPITMEQMIHHCQAVKRGAPNRPLLVGDMPFGTYEYDDLDIALRNAYCMVKDGGMDAVKMEGGGKARAKTVKKVVEGGVAVMGHVGLTPQAISVIGGFRAQGRTAARARQLLDEALRLQDAGAFCIVLECVPSNVAAAITDTLEVPTIGIGAGGGTSGQVLVYHDMLGMLSHPHHEQFMPKFCKRYADVGHAITKGLEEYKTDVESGIFPGKEFAPYVMTEEEKMAFDHLLSKDAEERQRKHDEAAVKLKQADEYEQLSLYGDNSKTS